jgi:AraC-like DNA-binding protein
LLERFALSSPIVLARPPQATGAAMPAHEPSNRVMWITPDRVFYAGLLGTMSTRTMGGWMVYASLGAPLRVALDTPAGPGRWQTAPLAVVPPYLPHRVACDERLICTLTLEPESVDTRRLPDFLRGPPGARSGDHGLAGRLRQAHDWLRGEGRRQCLRPEDFDDCVLGQPVAARRIEPRIRGVLDRMRGDPAQNVSATDCAASVGLSCSRFLHLFKDEVGASFRSVRTWKRARSLLHHVNKPANLAHLALDSGYPDSTHFSHSIRQVYGLTPRDLFAGSRRLTLLGGAPTRAG